MLSVCVRFLKIQQAGKFVEPSLGQVLTPGLGKGAPVTSSPDCIQSERRNSSRDEVSVLLEQAGMQLGKGTSIVLCPFYVF